MKYLLIIVISWITSAPFVKAQDLPEMIKVTGGTFTMGDENGTGEPDEKPTRKITVSNFNISRTEVTVAQWRAFCTATKHSMPLTPDWEWKADHPVVSVTALEADEYCKWLSLKTGKEFRLSHLQYSSAAMILTRLGGL